MWAGLYLTEDDLPQTRAGNFYPLELVRALTLTWLFIIDVQQGKPPNLDNSDSTE